MQTDSIWVKRAGGSLLRKGKIHMYVWWRCCSKPQSHFFNCTRSDTSMNAWHLLAAHLFPRDSKKCFFPQKKTGSMCNSKRVKSVCDTFFVVFVFFLHLQPGSKVCYEQTLSMNTNLKYSKRNPESHTHTVSHSETHSYIAKIFCIFYSPTNPHVYICMYVCMCIWMYVCKKK